jgi:hypothetical protein
MSAFIVSTGTMNRVVQAIMHTCPHFDGEPTRPPAVRLQDVGTHLGIKLYRLNAEAVRQRYDQSEPVPLFRSTQVEAPRTRKEWIACFKALQCLSYQCSEGDVPDTPLYRELETVRYGLAARIIADLPEYQAAKWDE